jgi:hypothetical protein
MTTCVGSVVAVGTGVRVGGTRVATAGGETRCGTELAASAPSAWWRGGDSAVDVGAGNSCWLVTVGVGSGVTTRGASVGTAAAVATPIAPARLTGPTVTPDATVGDGSGVEVKSATTSDASSAAASRPGSAVAAAGAWRAMNGNDGALSKIGGTGGTTAWTICAAGAIAGARTCCTSSRAGVSITPLTTAAPVRPAAPTYAIAANWSGALATWSSAREMGSFMPPDSTGLSDGRLFLCPVHSRR